MMVTRRTSPKVTRTLTLARRDLDLERTRTPARANIIYQFSSSDLLLRDGSTVAPEVCGDDLEVSLRSDGAHKLRKDESRKKKRCLCLNVVIIGKTPAFDGRLGSKYSGGKWKVEPPRGFLSLFEDAMVPLFDSCIDGACLHVVECNLDGKEWQRYFAKDGNGRYLEYIDAGQWNQFVKAIQDSLPTLKNNKCAWLFFNRISDGPLPPLRKGTTPLNWEKVPGTETFRPKSSDGILLHL